MTQFRLSDLAKLPRLTRAYHRFLRTPITAQRAVEVIQTRLVTREERFVQIAERAIYGHPDSPYLTLLRWAGCELGDLTNLLDKEGLEKALSRLVEAGVYITFDEFKGRKQVVRGGRQFAFAERDFDNPGLTADFEVQSGGTRSPGTLVKVGLAFTADLAVDTALALDAQGLSRHDHAIWLFSGVSPALIYAKMGRPPVAWFYPLKPLPLRVRARARYLAVLSRLGGCPLPEPIFLDLQEPARMAAWLAARLMNGKTTCVTTYASSAVRVCSAAKETGLNLSGVCFITLGEPFTEAKQRIVEAAGARALVRYAFTEAGIIGYGCADPQLSDDLHFLSDCYGLIQRERTVGDSGPSVQAYLFTSLLSSTPKILLNVESGDYGLVEQRGCGCRLGSLGLTTHLGRIRSFEKLSSEGMTFVQTDLLRVLEDILPSRFGGASADYQALEEEGENGILRLLLNISPAIGPIDEEQVKHTFLDELARDGRSGQTFSEFWRRAGTVQVRRQRPVATKAGKILPFHLIKAKEPSRSS